MCVFDSFSLNCTERSICMLQLINLHPSYASQQINLMQTKMNCIIMIRLLANRIQRKTKKSSGFFTVPLTVKVGLCHPALKLGFLNSSTVGFQL